MWGMGWGGDGGARAVYMSEAIHSYFWFSLYMILVLVASARSESSDEPAHMRSICLLAYGVSQFEKQTNCTFLADDFEPHLRFHIYIYVRLLEGIKNMYVK